MPPIFCTLDGSKSCFFCFLKKSTGGGRGNDEKQVWHLIFWCRLLPLAYGCFPCSCEQFPCSCEQCCAEEFWFSSPHNPFPSLLRSEVPERFCTVCSHFRSGDTVCLAFCGQKQISQGSLLGNVVNTRVSRWGFGSTIRSLWCDIESFFVFSTCGCSFLEQVDFEMCLPELFVSGEQLY